MVLLNWDLKFPHPLNNDYYRMKPLKTLLLYMSPITALLSCRSGNLRAYYHQDMTLSADPGDFELFIGTNSVETKKISFDIQ